MGNKDSYAKGVLLHDGISTVDWDNLNADFVVLRVGATPAALEATGQYVDQRYAEFVQAAYERGIPVIAWFDLTVKKYGDTSWPVHDFSRWYPRAQDMAMSVIDRMLQNRPYFHGMILGVDPGTYNAQGSTYDVSALWVSRTVLRVKDLVKAAYKKLVWPEFRAGVIDNKAWDSQGLLELDSQNWIMSVWDYSKSAQQAVTGKLDLYALSWPEEHMPMYLMPTRSGSFWRCKTVAWSGAKNAAGAVVPLIVYLYYGSKDSLYKAIGFTAPAAPGEPEEPEEPTEPTEPDPGGSVTVDLAETNAKLQAIIDMLEPISAFFARFK